MKNLLNKVLKKVLKKVAFPKNTQKSRVLLKKVEIYKNCFNNFLLTEFFEKIVTQFILCRSQNFCHMYAELTGHQTISTQFFAGLSLSEYNTVDQSQESIVVQNL